MVIHFKNSLMVLYLIFPILLGLVFSPFFITQSVQAVAVSTSVSVVGLSFSLDSASVDLGSATPGTPVTTTSTLTVTTGNASGFNIKVNRNDASTTLDLDSDQSINMPDRTPWDPTTNSGDGNASVWQASDRHLGLRVRQTGTDSGNYNSTWWGSDDTDSNSKFAGFPSSSETIVNRTSSAPTGTDITILYKLDTPNTQRTGVYSGGIIYTATVNL